MKYWALLSPVFWRVLGWVLIADWGSKALINLLIEPIRFPRGPLSELVGKVFPYPPGHVSIAHTEHWHEHWYDLDGGTLQVYNLIERATPFQVPMVSFFLVVSLGVPLLISLASLGQRRPQVMQSIALGFWLAALIGNKGEAWLSGHVTDWIWVRFGRFSVFTNLADVMLLAALVILALHAVGRGPKDFKGSSGSVGDPGLSRSARSP